jgi:tetratricopeptide (TPR) repeat protein
VSCNEAAQPYLEQGLALLHHMTYDGAAQAFAAAAEADPQCAMGYWGEALTFIHPLWSDPPTETTFKKGKMLIEKAKRLELSGKEKAYLAAVEAYYAEGWNRNETAHLARFDQAWAAVFQQYPEDMEAVAFYALAHMATADPSDKTFAKQKRAGALAEQVLAQDPNHPGAHHYIIHAYDNPALAAQALEVARHYGEVAPAVPHALHMPTHIFTRLGLWDESIAWNKRSATSALDHPMGEAISLHYLHALDYLAYAYLQRAEDQKARKVLETVSALEGPYHVEVATPYTLAAVPARLALERQQWAEAAALQPRIPSDYPWEPFPAIEAITHFARALGAARSGSLPLAREALKTLATLKEQAATTSAYWAKQVDIQHQTATAWLAYAEGQQDEALTRMQQAAALEASTEKHPVTPGEVLPARELLGDMLLEMGRHEEALAAYTIALERSPNRFNSLYGAGRAAELSGDKPAAARYYAHLTEMTAHADTELARLQHARTFLNAN